MMQAWSSLSLQHSQSTALLISLHAWLLTCSFSAHAE